MRGKAEFTIIVPVLDEAAGINQMLAKLQKDFSNEAVEVIVVDGDSNGETVRSIKAANVITAVSEKGRARQMNAGAARASSDMLLFLHADTELPQQALGKVRRALENYCAGAFDIKFVGNRLFYKMMSFIVSLRSRLTRVPYGDQAQFFRKDYFERLGGYADIPIMEDVDIMYRIKQRGDRIALIRDRVKTSTRRWQAEGPLFTMMRNITLSSLFRWGVPAEKLAPLYKCGRSVYRTESK